MCRIQQQRYWVLTGLIALSFCLSSCGPEQRKSPPVITIMVLEKWNTYLLDGQEVTREVLEVRLQRTADNFRRDITGTSRAYVRIASQTNDSDIVHEKKSIMNYCMKIGLDKVQLQ